MYAKNTHTYIESSFNNRSHGQIRVASRWFPDKRFHLLWVGRRGSGRRVHVRPSASCRSRESWPESKIARGRWSVRKLMARGGIVFATGYGGSRVASPCTVNLNLRFAETYLT